MGSKGGKGRNWEAVKLDFGKVKVKVRLNLAVMDIRGNKMDRDVVGGNDS